MLGNKRVNIADWTDSKKERVVDVELEDANYLNIVLKCNI